MPPTGSVQARDLAAPIRQMEGVLALILAGGRGTRLSPLTAHRAKPAMPMAGRHRLIDFTLSNCVNSGVPRIGVLGQYRGESLLSHLRQVWGAGERGSSRHVEWLPSQQGADECSGYRGTADAVHQNRSMIEATSPAQVLVLAGDHVYRMNYADMLDQHRRSGAQLTVGCVEVPLAEARGFGVMQIDRSHRILSFAEKPAQPEPVPGREDIALASMGIYVFDTPLLLDLLARDADDAHSSHDFGKDVIPAAVRKARSYAYRLCDLHDPQHQGYWRDVGTLDAYWRSNLELAEPACTLDTADLAWPIRGLDDAGAGPSAAACRFGCGVQVHASVIFPAVCLGPHCEISDSILLPGVQVGAGCVLRKTIVDEGCTIPAGLRIGTDPALDRERFAVSPGGVVVITPEDLARLDRAHGSLNPAAIAHTGVPAQICAA